MALPEFDYIAAKSYEEASKLMASMGSECVVMSGGTDVILQIPKFVSRGMKTVIDLRAFRNRRDLNSSRAKACTSVRTPSCSTFSRLP